MRHIVLIFCIFAFLTATTWTCARADVNGVLLMSVGLTDHQFEDKAKEYLGIPYQKGGTSQRGMDCSGFARVLYDEIFNIDLPHNSVEQYRFTRLQEIPGRKMQPGDLVFFGSSKKKRINHVGVYLSNDKFIHASTSQGITVSKLTSNYWKKRFVGSKRYVPAGVGAEGGQLQMAAAATTSVGHNASLTGDLRRGLRSHAAVSLQNTQNTIADAWSEIPQFTARSGSIYQLGHIPSPIHAHSINFSAIREEVTGAALWPEPSLFILETDYYEGIAEPVLKERWGVKMAGDIFSNDWFSITPSICYFNDAIEIEGSADDPKRLLGLNSLLAPRDGKWSLAMLLQYTDQQGLFDAAAFDSMHSSLDMSVRLDFNLTENLRVAVMGKHDIRSHLTDKTGESIPDQVSVSDILFTLDLAY